MDFIPQWQEAQRHVHALASLGWQKSTLLLQRACEAGDGADSSII